jgi:hypothetical protein
MTTLSIPEESELARQCLLVAREASIIAKPYSIIERRKAASLLEKHSEIIKRILNQHDNTKG